MILGELVVHGGGGALPAVGGVAFDDGAVHQVYKVCDQVGVQVIAGGRLAGVQFDGHIAGWRPAQGIVDI